MSYPVIDTPNNTTRKLAQFKALGITSIIRYNDRFSAWKQIKTAEARAIADAGLQLGLVYEHTATPNGEALGHADAKYCRAIAPDLGQPAGSGIYFAVDYDASQWDLTHKIIPYFEGVQEALEGSGFRIGVYGSGLTCRVLKEKHLVELTWPTCSRGFTESRSYIASRAWDIWQVACDTTLAGQDVDINAVNSPQWGQFTPWGPPIFPQPPLPIPTPHPLYDNFWVQSSLNKLGAHLTVDGIMGPQTQTAIRVLQSANMLVIDGICGPLTTALIVAKLAQLA